MSVRLNRCFLFCSNTEAALFSQPWLMSLTVRQIITTSTCFLPISHPLILCVEEEMGGGMKADYLHSSKSKINQKLQACSLCHVHSLYFFLSVRQSVLFVDKDRNLCYAAFGWSCRTPFRLSAKWLSYIEKNGILVAVTPPQLVRIIAGYNICVDITQAQTQVDNTIHTVYVR